MTTPKKNSLGQTPMAALTEALAEQCCKVDYTEGAHGPSSWHCVFDRTKAEQIILRYLEQLEDLAIAKALEQLDEALKAYPQFDVMIKKLTEVHATLTAAQTPL